MDINIVNYNKVFKRLKYALSFLKYGIFINMVNGNLHYLSYTPKCQCEKLQIMRHGKTIGSENQEFMSDTSSNSELSEVAEKEVEVIFKKMLNDLPDDIIVSTLGRTMATYNIFQNRVPKQVSVTFSKEMRGINNGQWAGKTLEMLDEDNLYIFLQRECSHNVFVKSENGDSWADVLYRCTKILKKLNRRHKNRRVLLISQGSVYQGLIILLHKNSTPWENYSAEKMFNLTQDIKNKSIEYGNITTIY